MQYKYLNKSTVLTYDQFTVNIHLSAIPFIYFDLQSGNLWIISFNRDFSMFIYVQMFFFSIFSLYVFIAVFIYSHF